MLPQTCYKWPQTLHKLQWPFAIFVTVANLKNGTHDYTGGAFVHCMSKIHMI